MRITLTIRHIFRGVVPLVLRCQHKMDFREVDRKEAWQTIGLLVANSFTGEHQGRLVHTQLCLPLLTG